jgi:hypothetical protein
LFTVSSLDDFARNIIGTLLVLDVGNIIFAVDCEAAVRIVMLHALLRSCGDGLIPRDDDVDGMNAITPLCRAI